VALTASMKDKNKFVREEAARALKEIGWKKD
jgi:HEAT repeat protein